MITTDASQPQASDYFSLLTQLALAEWTPEGYTDLYQLLLTICEQETKDYPFPNLFSRLGYVCRQHHIKEAQARELQALRRKCHHREEQKAQEWLSDVRSLTEFVGEIYQCQPPSELLQLLPRHIKAENERRAQSYYKKLRVSVTHWDSQYIYAEKDEDDEQINIRIDYLNGGYDGDLGYIIPLLTPQSTLNLLKTKVEDGVYLPESLILEPDYLVEVSQLAACFKEYGHHPLNAILMQLEPHQNNPYNLLGNAAGQFLDDLIGHTSDETPPTYVESLRRSFQMDPIAFSFVQLNQKFNFHEEAQRQFQNLYRLISQELESNYGFQLNKALIEPSFVCEALGLSGRMDFLQSDFKKLIEQKSGKRDEFRHTHKEVHYIQMMLYQAILDYNLGATSAHTDCYLLYSKYADGLLYERPYLELLRKALAVRNQIVALQLQCAEGKLREHLENLRADDLLMTSPSRLWTDYQKPQLQAMLRPFAPATSERGQCLHDYFYRFHTFISREQLQGKMIAPGETGHAFADLWNLPAGSRRALGALYSQLKVEHTETAKTGTKGIINIRLRITEENGFLSNFRPGDAVLFYRYEGDEPDVRRQFLMRGTLRKMTIQYLEVELRHPQRNYEIFDNPDSFFAVEHDRPEAATNRLFSGLYSFLTGNADRQDLLLNRRQPRRRPACQLVGDYGPFEELVRKERQADDIFFVIGPPGSGKTSFALRYMIEEELHDANSHILVMAYTNRAVDELCNMLDGICESGLLDDYVRLGSVFSAEEKYHHRFLSERMEYLKKAGDIRRFVSQTRVFVGTTSTMASQTELLKNIPFETAFIDEASQILEPQLLPFFFANNIQSGLPSIHRFVLVGDQKQLPAVVQQSSELSRVNEPSLQAAGLTDCRNSLFERLLTLQQRAGRSDLYHLIETQGRMHPDLFGFVNQTFYQNRLACVPLPHQERRLNQFYPHAQKALHPLVRLMASHRMAFLHCPPTTINSANDKTNQAEAHLVACCLKALQDAYQMEGRTLEASNAGIIVPYRNQIAAIRKEMEQLELEHLLSLTIDTVERYQGSQRDIIFYLFTVKNFFQLDFLTASTYLEGSDGDRPYMVDRKLNVALTRSREQTFLIGNATLLRRNALYRELIDQLQQSNHYFNPLKQE